MAFALKRLTSTRTFLTMTSDDGAEYEVELTEVKGPLLKAAAPDAVVNEPPVIKKDKKGKR